MQQYITINNNEITDFENIPLLSYEDFSGINLSFLKDINNHCVNYFGVPCNDELMLVSCIANDSKSRIKLTRCKISISEEKLFFSLTSRNTAFHMFERELTELYGIKYKDHPWLKPVRYPADRLNKEEQISNYPFYQIESEELHEVGVGPIHAGVIEPGHFRFICKGEQIIHLEIQLGYQHRGIENMFASGLSSQKMNILAESIAGDTVAGHTSAFANLWNSLCGINPPEELQFVRVLALELERIAVHTGDLSAICGDIAYQLGASVYGRLRTPIINFMQSWCGSRFTKSLIKTDCCNYPFNSELKNRLLDTLNDYEKDFDEMSDKFMHNPGCMLRLEKTGVVTNEQALNIGAVGMAAKASGLKRDIRYSHPYAYYNGADFQPVIKHHGDVYSRTQIRVAEIRQSIAFIRKLVESVPSFNSRALEQSKPKPDSISISLVEGWRGEICHCAITDSKGDIRRYKIKDPSFHNWTALALAVRRNEISDFPICNKSFNLSYCGFDL
jgi:Ni,Fe-hydrogenase III large subunit